MILCSLISFRYMVGQILLKLLMREKEKAVNGIHGLMIQVELRKYKYLIFALQDVIPRQIRIAQHDKVRVL